MKKIEPMGNELVPKHKGGIDENGREYQWWDIGMLQSASPENRRRMKVYMKPTPHVILDQNIPLRGWYKGKTEPEGVRPRPCYTEALLTQPYGGTCSTRCAFCYVNNGVRGYRSQGVGVVDPQYPDKVRKQLSQMRTASGAYISSFTEPFQELEAVYHNTQRLSQVFIRAGLPIFYLSRRVPPAWAMEYLTKNPYSYMQFSINTQRSDVWSKISPFASPLEDILKAVEDYSRAGIYVSVQVNPIIAGIVTVEDIEELIQMLAERGANHLIFKHVEIVSSTVKPLVKKMKALFPERGKIFEGLFTETIGHIRTIKEAYRIQALNRYSAACRRADVTMSLCYEYRYERDKSGNITDKTGVSLAPNYTTSDQCHGRRVPVYTRKSTKDRWQPVLECDPAGCLYCVDNNGRALCGNKRMGEANALTPADLTKCVK